MDYSLLGAGLGTLPSLLAMLTGNTPMQNAQSTAANNGNFQGTGLTPAQVAAVSPDPAQATAAYNYANSGGQSTTNPQWKFGAPTVNANTASATPIVSTAPTAVGSNNNGTAPQASNSNPLASLAAALTGNTSGTGNNTTNTVNGLLNSASASALPSGATQLNGVKPVQPSYAGTGPNAAALAAIAPSTAMTSPQLASGGLGAPLGPAASNPLLMMLKQRLGIA